MDKHGGYKEYLKYQEYLKSRQLDLAGEIGLLATSSLVMPIESKPYVNPSVEIKSETTEDVHDQETIARISHIAIVASDIDTTKALNRAVSPEPQRELSYA